MSGVTGKPRQTRLHVLLLAAKSHKKRLCGHPINAPSNRHPVCRFFYAILPFFSSACVSASNCMRFPPLSCVSAASAGAAPACSCNCIKTDS